MTTYSVASGALGGEAELQRVLQRAVSMTNAISSSFMDDDMHACQCSTIFHRAFSLRLANETDDDAHFEMAASWAKRAHAAAGAGCVLQAAVFEAIFPVNDIAIPAWVFEDLGQVVEKRHFQYEDMLGGLPLPDQAMGGSVWSGGGVPDLTQRKRNVGSIIAVCVISNLVSKRFISGKYTWWLGLIGTTKLFRHSVRKYVKRLLFMLGEDG